MEIFACAVGETANMKTDKWIYTFTLHNAKNISDLWHLIKDYPLFYNWCENFGLKPFLARNPELILNALVHTSFVHEQSQINLTSNERLEFLGDAFLDVEISLLLWEKFPNLKEGDLSKFRSALVNEEVLSNWGRILQIDSCILLGRGESERTRVEAAIVADAFEALIGAMGLIDRELMSEVLLLWISKYDQNTELSFFDEKRLELFDPKTKLQEYTLELYREVPHYEARENREGDGFECSLQVRGIPLAQARGKSKKKAEMAAAKIVLLEEKYKNLVIR